MSNIHDINIIDIDQFLSNNNVKYENLTLEQKYQKVYDLMKNKNTKYDKSPDSIVQWMLAHNALLNNVKIPLNINTLSNEELSKLAKDLGMRSNKIENVIEIIRFMNLLKFNENTDLYVSLLENSDPENAINLLVANPKLKGIFIELLPKMIEQLIKKKMYEGKIYASDIFFEQKKLNKFLIKLIKYDYNDIFNQSIKIYHDLFIKLDGPEDPDNPEEEFNNVYSSIALQIGCTDESTLTKLFRMKSENYNFEQYFHYISESGHSNFSFLPNNYDKNLPEEQIDLNCQMSVLRAIIAAKNKDIPKIMLNGWGYDNNDTWLLEIFEREGNDTTEMQNLVAKAKKLFLSK